MKILQVIHGYPMRYNAGSEVYTQTLAHALARRHQVHVFTREEDSFAPDYALRREPDAEDPRVALEVVNIPRSRDRYRHPEVDQRFAEVLERVRPDVVHVGHLNHLSTSLLSEAADRKIPIIYTLHDYWLMCPRGQFMQMHPENPAELWTACDGQEDKKCAQRCYARYFSGAPGEEAEDVEYWGRWVERRMRHIREMADLVDLFIAPSQYLLRRYRDEFGLPEHKLTYLDYGFELERLRGRTRRPGEPFTFGYIGTHIPAKGIHQLIEAFGRLRGSPRLRIWGRPRGQDSEALVALARALPGDASSRVEWIREYRNREITREVFDHLDCIVVPSIWVENSPLVIHEAQQARVPVITANAGGMAEYVQHEVNGLLFEHRSSAALSREMQRLVDDPELARKLGRMGYLASENGDVPEIDAHARAIEAIYEKMIARRRGPWRITFDTNPDTCNLRCVMCEEHSPYSDRQRERRAQHRPPRRMPIELVRKIIAEAAPRGLREVIPSTMGEPLLYEDFDEIIELCKKYGVRLNLTTNGTFPRRGAREWARRIVPIASDVKISWNGATKETQEQIMLGAVWERMLEDARTFIGVRDEEAKLGGHRCRVTFQLTFLEANVEELPKMVDLAIELGVDRVKGHHLWAHFEALRGASMRRNAEAISRWNQAVARAQAIAAERRLPNGERILLENIFVLTEEAVVDLAPDAPCPFLGREAWVSAEGRFDPCCAPDEQRRTLGELGNLHHQTLEEIWNGAAYQNLRATYPSHALCKSCNMRQPASSP